MGDIKLELEQDRHGLGQSFEVDVIVHPEDQFYLGKISITIVMFGLLVDSLGLAAVYVPYKVKHDLLMPMLTFYGLLVPTAVAALVILALETVTEDHQGRPRDHEEEATDQMMLDLPSHDCFLHLPLGKCLQALEVQTKDGGRGHGSTNPNILAALGSQGHR